MLKAGPLPGCISPVMRRYRGDEDYWRIREFLREVFVLNGWREMSWHVYRWDYWYWHVNLNIEHCRMEEVIFIWETPDGQIAAVLNPEDNGQAYLQVHPQLRTPNLEDEMLAVAEEYLALYAAGGSRSLCVWANQFDTSRQESLKRCGYTKTGWSECQHRRPLTLPLSQAPVPEGYTIRALGGSEELPARSLVSWQAFHPAEPIENYRGWTWYCNIQRAPLYRRDLDLVVVAPDGTLASFCTIWFDDVTRSGAFEPVGTAPAHQQRGVGKALLSEGLRRLERLGATMALVASSSPAARALYTSAGFKDFDLYEQWKKEI